MEAVYVGNGYGGGGKGTWIGADMENVRSPKQQLRCGDRCPAWLGFEIGRASLHRSAAWVVQGIYGGKYGEGNNTGLETEFLTAMIKGGTDGFAVKGGDAAAGPLKLMFDGPRPHGCERHQTCLVWEVWFEMLMGPLASRCHCAGPGARR